MAVAASKRKQNPFDFFQEELVFEILKRLPPKPLFKLMMVSRRCRSLVSDPKFAQLYLKYSSPALQLRGLLYPFWYDHPRSPSCPRPFGCSATAPPPPLRHSVFFHFTTRCPVTRILGSGNGLVLSQMSPFLPRWPQRYHAVIRLCLSNPLTKQLIFLPETSLFFSCKQVSCGFATRGGAFKVVLFSRLRYPRNPRDAVTVEARTLCSALGEWRELEFVETGPLHALFNDSSFTTAQDFCHKGVLHWLDTARRTLLTYDPFHSPHTFGRICLPLQGSVQVVGLGENQSGDPPLPLNPPLVEVVATMVVARLGHEDELIECCEVERRFGGLSLGVWRLEDYEKQEWSLHQRFEISPLCPSTMFLKDCRRVVAPDPRDPEQSYCYVFARDKRVTIIDLASGEEEDVGIPSASRGMHEAFQTLPLFPFVLSPWSSLHFPPLQTLAISNTRI